MGQDHLHLPFSGNIVPIFVVTKTSRKEEISQIFSLIFTTSIYLIRPRWQSKPEHKTPKQFHGHHFEPIDWSTDTIMEILHWVHLPPQPHFSNPSNLAIDHIIPPSTRNRAINIGGKTLKQSMNLTLFHGLSKEIVAGGINKKQEHDFYISSSWMKPCINYLQESRKPR